MNTIFKSTKLNLLSFLAFVAIIATGSLLASAPALAAGPAPVNLLSANNFVILSQTGITDTGSHSSAITGNIGASPITAAAMNDVFCSEVTGKIYGVDAAYVGSGATTCFVGNPPSVNKTLVDNAVLDMATAYTDSTGRTNPTATELGAGNIGGMTLAPGLYKWSTDVTIPANLTLSGGPNDVWIFQIAGNLNIASGGSVPAGVKVILSGGAQASNVFWQVGGVTGATLGSYATFNGNILSAKQVIIQTGAVLNGRALAQTQITLDANSISIPTLSTSTIFALTVTKSGNGTGVVSSNEQQGINCGSICTQNYASGTVVSLTVVPDSNSNFSDTWSGAGCSGNGSCVVTVTGNTIVNANFSLNAISGGTIGTGGTTGTISGTVLSGSQVGGTISGGSGGSSISGVVTGGGSGNGGGSSSSGGTGGSTSGGGSFGSVNESTPSGSVGSVLGASIVVPDPAFPIGGVRAGEPINPWHPNYFLIIISIILMDAFIAYVLKTYVKKQPI
jgi:hypothetical protein